MGKRKLSYFGIMLVMFTITILSMAIILSAFSYHQLSEALKEKSYADYQSALNKNAQTWETLYSEFSQLKQSLIVDPQIESYFELTEYDPIETYNTFLKAKKVFNVNPFTEALCLYQPNFDEQFYCGTDEIDLATAWEHLKKENQSVILPAQRTDTHANLLILGYPVYVNTFSEPQGAIFLCVNARDVAEYIMGDISYSQVILDKNNNILLYTGMLPDATLTEWIAGHNGTINETIPQNQEKIICSLYEENGLKFVNFVNYSEIIHYIRNREIVFLLVCVLIATLSAVLQALVVKGIYRPIALIKGELEDSKFATDNTGNEFDLIRQVHREAVHQVTALEEKNNEAQLKMREDTLRGLFIGSINSKYAESRLKDMGWCLPSGSCFLVSVQLDANRSNNTDYSLQNIISQTLQEKTVSCFHTETFRNGSHEIIALIATRENSNATFEDLVSALNNTIVSITSGYPVNITVGLDGLIQKITDCNSFYLKVKELQKNRFALGENQLIYPAKVTDLLPEFFQMPEKLMHEIHTAFLKGEKESYQEKVNAFLDIIRQYTYNVSITIFARLYLELLADVQKYVSTGKENCSTIEMKMNPGTIQEAKDLLYSAFDVMTDHKAKQEKLKENQHYKKIQKSRDFIASNYGDCSLGVEQLAEQLGYSSNYFSRIFKNITGYYVNDYIRQVRIVKAQELLTDTSLTISEIAAMTGFTTDNYFYSIFKKETGMTPAAYRNVKYSGAASE